MEIRPLVCKMNGCQRRFKTDYNLKRHRLLHNTVGKYKCETCCKTFIKRSSLNHHSKRHVFYTKNDENLIVTKMKNLETFNSPSLNYRTSGIVIGR